MANFTDFTKEQQEQIIAESGYTREDWESQDEILIPRSEFKDYAEELANDIGAIDTRNSSWLTGCVDWDQAADKLEQDYSSVTVDNEEYLYRAW